MLSALAALATVMFTGVVPPHAARDGLIFTVSAPAEADVRASLRSCGIRDFAGRDGNFKFAVAMRDEAVVGCLKARLPETAQVAKRDRWVD